MFYPTKRQFIVGILYFFIGHMLILPPVVFELTAIFTSGELFEPLFQFSMILISTVFYCYLFRKNIRESFKNIKSLKPLWKLIPLGYIITLILRFIVSLLIVLFSYDDLNMGVNQEIVETVIVQAPVLIAITAIILAPIWEELFFTGLIFGKLRKKNRFLAYAVASLSFGLLHTWFGFIVDFDWMLVLITLIYVPSLLVSCWLYEKTNNILSAILFHSFANAFAVFAILLS